MPRKYRAPIPRLPPPSEPPEEDWGEDPEEDLLPMPPPPTRSAESPSAPPESLVANGPPPDNAAAMQAWGYRALNLQAHEAMMDSSISQATRRKEVRTILAAAARLYPDAARYELAELIKRDERELGERKRARAAAKLEARPNAGGAKVIPLRRGG